MIPQNSSLEQKEKYSKSISRKKFVVVAQKVTLCFHLNTHTHTASHPYNMRTRASNVRWFLSQSSISIVSVWRALVYNSSSRAVAFLSIARIPTRAFIVNSFFFLSWGRRCKGFSAIALHFRRDAVQFIPRRQLQHTDTYERERERRRVYPRCAEGETKWMCDGLYVYVLYTCCRWCEDSVTRHVLFDD